MMNSREKKEAEETFFELDRENNIAEIRLKYDKASDLFDPNLDSREPVLNEFFLEEMKSSFRMISSSFRLAFHIEIQDPQGYTESELKRSLTTISLWSFPKAVRKPNGRTDWR